MARPAEAGGVMRAWEREVGRIAGAQDNVIDLAQLHSAGVTRGTLEARVLAGEWQRLHQRVYLIGPAPPSFRARARAAVMAVGADCASGGETAAALHGLRPELPEPIEIIVSGRSAAPRKGIVIHRSHLLAREVVWLDGIPVTTVARTICDEAATLAMPEVEQMLIAARVDRLVRDAELRAVIDHAPHRPGSGRMRRLLSEEAESGYSRSAAERRLRRLLAEAGLPLGIFNEYLCGLQIDCHWPAARLVLEVDGYLFHGHRAAFERDRRRDQILVAAGWRVIRVTWRQLVNDAMAIAVRIAQALAIAAVA